MKRIALVAVALAVASPALAQISPAGPSSGRWGSVDIGFGQYTPDVDSEFPQSPGPWEKMFGTKPGWMFSATVSKSLFTRYGSLDVGFKSGFFSKSGAGYLPDGTRAGTDSSFRMIPTSAVLTYRFDLPVERWKVPLAPYGRVAFERYNWWITRGDGGSVEKGATNGWSAAGGLALLVDMLDPQLAREFDLESGVNHTYLFFEVTTGKIDDFGSSKSWDLSPKGFTWLTGMTFVF